MKYLKLAIALMLIDIGTALDHIPAFYPSKAVRGRFPIYWGQYGCMSGYCEWAATLDEKWETNIYKPV